MFILSGKFECWKFDFDTEEVVETKIVGPGDYVFVPSMETHGMRNVGVKPATFLCCIGNVY